jgi:hypothetical protein
MRSVLLRAAKTDVSRQFLRLKIFKSFRKIGREAPPRRAGRGLPGELEVPLWLSAFGLAPAIVAAWQTLERIFCL